MRANKKETELEKYKKEDLEKIKKEFFKELNLNENEIKIVSENFADPNKNLFLKNLNNDDSISASYKKLIDSKDVDLNFIFSLRTAQSMVKQLGGKESAIKIAKKVPVIRGTMGDAIESFEAMINTSEDLRSKIRISSLEERIKDKEKIIKLQFLFIIIIVIVVVILGLHDRHILLKN